MLDDVPKGFITSTGLVDVRSHVECLSSRPEIVGRTCAVFGRASFPPVGDYSSHEVLSSELSPPGSAAIGGERGGCESV